MSRETLAPILEAVEEAGCLNLSEFSAAVQDLELDEEELEALYAEIEERGISLTDDCGRIGIEQTHFKPDDLAGTTTDALITDATRKAQAMLLAAFLANPVATFGDPDVLIIGDLNAYAEEDPIDILRAGGFSNQLERFHPEGTRIA